MNQPFTLPLWAGKRRFDRRAGPVKREMDETLITTLSEGAAAIGIRLGPAELDRFATYHREILLWNRRINLVSNALRWRSSSAIFSIH